MLTSEPSPFREGKLVSNWPLQGLLWHSQQLNSTGRRKRVSLVPEAYAASREVLRIHYPLAVYAGSRVICPVCRTAHPCATVSAVINAYRLPHPADVTFRRFPRERKP